MGGRATPGGKALSADGAARLAWSVCAVSLALTFAALVFVVLNPTTPGGVTLGSRVSDVMFVVALLAFPAVGALVASRRPENPIGWLFTGSGLALAVIAFANGYAIYALFTNPGSLPAGEAMAWLQSWLFAVPLFMLVTLLLLLFPNGRLFSRRWRPVALARGRRDRAECRRGNV